MHMPIRTKFVVRTMLWGAATLLVAFVLLSGAPERVVMQAPVIGPDDVATPTPQPVLLPTPTPTPGRMEPNSPAETYTVRLGDTLWSIALEIGVDLDEMPCMVGPSFQPGQPLVVGDMLTYLPLGWRCHPVVEGETLGTIAMRYGVSAQEISRVAWNQVGPIADELVDVVEIAPPPGSYLRVPQPFVPDGRGSSPGLMITAADGDFLGFMLTQPLTVAPAAAYAVGGPRRTTVGPVPKDWPYGSGNFTWPVYGWLTQGYREDHRAIDIAAPVGAFVTAADRGVVIRAGWNEQGYGLFVVIDHNIDYVTLYSHLSDVYVREGEVVGQGQVIGTVGSTGNSTGPHLHFEIRDFGRRTNPLGLLVR